MNNKVEVKIDASVICYDCALRERCSLIKKNVPIVGLTNWRNGKGIVTAYCHVKKGGAQ